MASRGRAGRPPLAGRSRYSNGRVRETRANGVVRQRYRRLADPRFGSEIQMLGGEFSDNPEICLTIPQIETAEWIGRVWRTYLRLVLGRDGLPTTPGYLRYVATTPDEVAEDEQDAELPEDEDRRIARARMAWDRCREVINSLEFPPESLARLWDTLETLCVNNQPIAQAVVPHLGKALDLIELRRGGRRTAPRPKPTPSIAITARQPPRQRRQKPRPEPRAVERQAFFHVLRALGQPEHAIEVMWQRTEEARAKFYALADRDKYRAEKRREA